MKSPLLVSAFIHLVEILIIVMLFAQLNDSQRREDQWREEAEKVLESLKKSNNYESPHSAI
jgi:hypothetical protein